MSAQTTLGAEVHVSEEKILLQEQKEQRKFSDMLSRSSKDMFSKENDRT
jgi:hypothetical protein